MKNRSVLGIGLCFILLHVDERAQAQLIPEEGQNIWQWHADFLGDPANLVGEGEEGSTWELHQRSMSYWGERLYPTGEFGIARSALVDYLEWIQANPKGGGGWVSNWSCMGPFDTPAPENPVGNNVEGTGQIHAIAFDPNYATNGVMYCASAYGGMFKSVDHGAHWTNMTDNELPIIGITDIVVDAQQPSHLFVATGNVDAPLGYTAGVYRSFDGGVSWDAINTGLPLTSPAFIGMHAIEMSPSNPNEMICLTSMGIYRSSNVSSTGPAEVQWTLSTGSPVDGDFKSLVYHPVLPNVVYASGSDVYRSMDGGESWTSMTTTFPGLDLSAGVFTNNPATRFAISIAQEAPYQLHTTIAQTNAGSGHAAYFDQVAQTWFLGDAIASDWWTSEAWCCSATSPIDNSMVAYGTTEVFFTHDHGISLNEVDDYYEEAHPDKHVLAFVKISETEAELWIGHDGGLSVTTDLVATNSSQCLFEDRNDGLVVGTIISMSSSPVDADEVWIGNQDVGNSLLLDRLAGVHDWRTKQGGDGGAVQFSPDGDKAWTWIYNSRNTFIKWRTSMADHVNYWYVAYDGHPNYMGAFGASEFPPMGFLQSTGQWWFGVSDIWKEDDIGMLPVDAGSFNRLTQIQCDVDNAQDLEFQLCNNQGHTNTVIHPMDERYIYFTTSFVKPNNGQACPGGMDMKLYRTVVTGNDPLVPLCDAQPRFELATLPTDLPVTAMLVDPADPLHIWASFSGFDAAFKVWQSFDRGSTWEPWGVQDQLPNLPVNDMVYHDGTEDGIYVGMDVGVYYRNTNTPWQSFFTDLPNVQVNDLDINYCAGKIRAGTFGRGLWESDLAEQPTVAQQITQNTTWSFHRNLAQDVRVMPGATLTITSTANFAPNTKLIIEPGAAVIVDAGGLLHNSCGKEWGGVQVLGNSALAQTSTNQGYFELRNGGTIENASIGILVGDLNDLTKGGGVVKIAGTQAQPGGFVRNCRPALRYMPYGYTPNSGYYTRNLGKFVHAVFEFTDAAVDADQGMDELIKLDGVDGIGFYACTFRNTIANVAETQLLGHGIHSLESRFRVTSTCPTPGTPCTAAQMVPSTFSGLDHGVHALGAAASSIFTVENSSFSNNIAGVFASGITGFKVWKNDFELTDRTILFTHPTEEFWGGRPRGIYTYESFGFKIQDNTLHSPTTGTLVAAEAIVVGYSRDHNDKIWKNIARDLSTGFVGEGIAASTEPGGYSGTIGLQILCSSNSNVDKNLYSRKIEGQTDANFHTIRTIQASAGRGADNTLDGWAGETDRWDFYKDTDAPITYYHRTAPNLYPEHVSDDVLVNGIPAASSSECTPNLISTDPNILVNGMLLDGRTQYGETRYLYEQLIDGGNTDAVVEEIESSWPQDVWDLRTYLLSKSPYLSTEALKELVDKYGVPEAIKAEILIANPDATQKDGFLKWAEYDAHYPLPAHLLASIRASWDVKTYRTTLEAQMAAHHARMTEAANELLDIYATRDSSGTHNDSLRWVWQQLPTVAARYAETLLRIQESDYTGAQALMNDLDEDHKLSTAEERERTRMGTLINDLLNLEQQARDVRKLDESEIAAWQTLIDGEYDRPATWISNMLCFHYGICRSPLTGGESEPKTLQRSSPEKPASTERSFKLQPNPASTFVTLNFELLPTENSARLLVQDAQGRIVATENLQGNVGQVVFDTRRWAKGVYTARCMVGEEPAHAEKLVIE